MQRVFSDRQNYRKIITDGQDMTQAITLATKEVEKAVVQAMAMAQAESDGPTLNYPSFDWNDTEKFTELRNFRLEVDSTFQHITQTTQADYQLSKTLNVNFKTQQDKPILSIQ